MSSAKQLKKDYPFNVLSEQHRCKLCPKRIKKRLTIQKLQVPELCYMHWMSKKAAKQTGSTQRPKN